MARSDDYEGRDANEVVSEQLGDLLLLTLITFIFL
jgi:hypothetical protein